MADNSAIEWTDATWNPIVGCSVLSPGCKHCYAMRLAGTLLRHHHSRAGLTVDTENGPVWNGQVRLIEEWLDQPLRWRRPRRIFVCAHGDLFHESVPDKWIDAVFCVIAQVRIHTFQLLTKRAARMRDYIGAFRPDGDGYVTRGGREAMGESVPGEPIFAEKRWPLPNVWLGVSAEDQRRADERIPHLLATPAAMRFISAEPLLGPVDLYHYLNSASSKYQNRLDWVIVGGESGPKARPMHPDWARSLRDQCRAAKVEYFFKQWGQWAPWDDDNWSLPGGWDDDAAARGRMCVGGTDFLNIGKKRAGRLLDGVEHNGFPEVRR